MTNQSNLATIMKMIENSRQICGESELMDIHPSQRSELDIDMPVTKKSRHHAKKSSQGASSSSRRDVWLGDDSDDDFVDPPPPTSLGRGRHSSGTSDDIRPDGDFRTPPRSSVHDTFFDVDLETAVVPDTPNPPSKYSRGLRGLFMRSSRRE